MDARPADPSETDCLAQLWYEGWQDAHMRIVPPDLVRLRTFESFQERMRVGLPQVRVIGPTGAPAGFYMLRGDEFYQLFVLRPARGTRVAGAFRPRRTRRGAGGGHQGGDGVPQSGRSGRESLGPRVLASADRHV